jgi:hypothetical protein
MTDTELLDKLQHMVDHSYGLSKLVSLDGHRFTSVRECIEAVNQETDGYNNPPARLIRMTFDETSGLDAAVNYPGVIHMAAEVAQMFRDGGAVNVFEFQVNPPDMAGIVVRFQRNGGKTDMQLRSEALRDLADALRQLDEERAKNAELESRLREL